MSELTENHMRATATALADEIEASNGLVLMSVTGATSQLGIRKTARVVAALRGWENSPDDIRALGWTVAIHNDYRQSGERHTFWLFTKGDRAIKGEGVTDADALNKVRAVLAAALDMTAERCDEISRRST